MRLTPKRLSDIAAFAQCRCQPSAPNMEKAREYLGELVDFVAVLLEEDMRHLQLLEFQEGRKAAQGNAKAFDAHETAQNTLRDREEMYTALHHGKGR